MNPKDVTSSGRWLFQLQGPVALEARAPWMTVQLPAGTSSV